MWERAAHLCDDRGDHRNTNDHTAMLQRRSSPSLGWMRSTINSADPIAPMNPSQPVTTMTAARSSASAPR
jgi:hypothetical protein